MTPRGHKSLPLSSGQYLVEEQAMSTKTAITNLLNLSESMAQLHSHFFWLR